MVFERFRRLNTPRVVENDEGKLKGCLEGEFVQSIREKERYVLDRVEVRRIKGIPTLGGLCTECSQWKQIFFIYRSNFFSSLRDGIISVNPLIPDAAICVQQNITHKGICDSSRRMTGGILTYSYSNPLRVSSGLKDRERETRYARDIGTTPRVWAWAPIYSPRVPHPHLLVM